MATRSRIGKKLEDGTIKSIYCHWDGYPEHNGEILKEHYKTEAKIDALLELGNLSSLAQDIGMQHDFKDPSPGWCVAYGRDRGEINTKARISTTLSDMMQEEYNYVWDNGKWRCYNESGREFVL
jgi:hypothetical protein